jgi:primosomal replication protein N
LNTLALLAHIAERSAPRYTPAGIPAADLILEHSSDQIEAGSSRKVSLKLRAIALGTSAEQIAKLPSGQTAKFKGFLASSKNGKGSTLHITDIEFI